MSRARHACAGASILVCTATAFAGEIRGRALVAGRPVAGVTVAVLPFEDGHTVARREARREEPKPLATALTRADGAFGVAMSAPTGTTVRVGFSGAGTTPVVLRRLVEGSGEDLGEIQLTKAVVLAGRVADERGGPVVGATLTLHSGRGRGSPLRQSDPGSAADAVPQTSTSGADGRFRFEAAADEENTLRVEMPAFATLTRSGVRSGAVTRPLTLATGQLLRGTVTLADKRTPAGGALVRFEGRTTTRWVEARPDGTFVIESAPRESGALVAEAGVRGRGTLVLAAAAGAEPVVIALLPTASLSGRVVDADAKPLRGVRLALRDESRGSFVTRSGADGRYALTGLSPGRYRLGVEDDRYVAWSQWLTVANGQAETRDVPLAPAAALSGRVVAEDGRPIAGAFVQVTGGSQHAFAVFMRSLEGLGAVRTAADGSFTVKRLAPGGNQRVDVRHEDFESRTVGGLTLNPGGVHQGLVVALRSGFTLAGFVKDEEERPIPGAEVTLSSTMNFRSGRGGLSMQMIGPGTQVQRETDAAGRFEFRGLKAGDFTVSARRSGFARATLDPAKVGEARQEPVQLVLRPGATLSGLVRDRAGSGAPGWFVSARPEGQGGPAFGPGATRSEEPTGSDGAFVLEGLSRGETYDLQVMGPNGLGPRRGGVTAPAEGLELVTSGSGQVRGRVVDAENGRAITDFELRYQPDSQGGGMRFVMRVGSGGGRGPYQKMAFHAEDGSFILDEVASGRWMVEAFARGYQSGSAANVVVNEGETLEGVEVRLARGSAVSGRVLDARSGRPVLDAGVRAELSGGALRMGMARMGNESVENEATTDAEGRFEITGLAPGKWRLTASHADHKDASETVEVKDAPVVAEIRLGQGGIVTGSVLAGGRPVGGAQVGLSLAGDSGRGMMDGDRTAITDEGGRFRFEHLEPGRYTVVAALREQSSAPVEAVLTGDESRDVQLALGAGAVIRGSVSGLPDGRLGGVNVSASGTDYFSNTRTAANGSFELSGAPEGTISINASAGDFMSGSRSASSSVTIAPGQAEAAVEIVFEQGLRVEGRVSRGGRPVTDAMVMAFPDGGGRRRNASGRTDESGGYVLEGLDEGAYEIQASSQNAMPIRRKVTLGADTTVDLEAAAARLAGTVVDEESSRPLADVEVRIEDRGQSRTSMSAVTTDSSGRFAMEDVEPAAYRVAFQRSGYQAEVRSLTASEDADVRVSLRRGEGIAIEAKDGVFGTPLRGLFVRVIDGSGAAAFTGQVTLDSDGRGEVPALKPGTYELRSSAMGYASVRLPGVGVPSSTLNLVLTPGGTLDVQCGPQTQALADATARLIGPDGRPYLWNAFTDDGKIRLGPARRLENVQPGRYVLQVEGGARRDVTITEGGTTAVTLP